MGRSARTRATASAALVALLLVGHPPNARGAFHLALINEFMTSYGGDPEVQFVEIVMEFFGQTIVRNSVLGAFDTTGQYVGDVLVVPSDVTNSGRGVTWIMATARFETVSGLTADFLMPAALPTGGGMICWGAPGTIPPAPSSWDHTVPANYVDCVAYGTYAGPCNVHICGCDGTLPPGTPGACDGIGDGAPTPLVADGHALARKLDLNGFAIDTRSSEADFECVDPATPTNNSGTPTSLAATTPCEGGTDTDGDGTEDASDTCPFVADPGQEDRDGNGIGDACQCGDVDRDGSTNVADALAIARGQVGSADAGFPHCDVTGDGSCDTADALTIARGEVSSAPEAQRCPAWSGAP